MTVRKRPSKIVFKNGLYSVCLSVFDFKTVAPTSSLLKSHADPFTKYSRVLVTEPYPKSQSPQVVWASRSGTRFMLSSKRRPRERISTVAAATAPLWEDERGEPVARWHRGQTFSESIRLSPSCQVSHDDFDKTRYRLSECRGWITDFIETITASRKS